MWYAMTRMGSADELTIATRSWSHRLGYAFLAAFLAQFLGVGLMVALQPKPMWRPVVWFAPAVIGVLLVLAYRRVLRVEGGRVEIGRGLVVPWRWSPLLPGATHVVLQARWGVGSQNGRTLHVDLQLWSPKDGLRTFMTCMWKDVAKARRIAEQVAAALHVPFSEMATGVGLRHHLQLDVPLGERIRAGQFPQQPLPPPRSIDVRADGHDVVIRLGRTQGPQPAVPATNTHLAASFMVTIMLIAPVSMVQAQDFEDGGVAGLMGMELFMVGLLGIILHVVRTRGEITRLRLTSGRLVAYRELLFLRPAIAVPFDTIEDVAVVREGPLAGGLAVTSDDQVLLFGYQLDEPGRDYLAATIAQWVAYRP